MIHKSSAWPPSDLNLDGYEPFKEDWLSLESRIFNLNRNYEEAPWRSFGNETRAALFFRAGITNGIQETAEQRDLHGNLNFERFFIRPSIEPIIYAEWNRFDQWNLDEKWALSITSGLLGGRAELRSQSTGLPAVASLPAFRYAPIECMGCWLEKCQSVRDMSDLGPLEAALLVHAIVALYHPMKDGNGRLARALFHGMLRNRAEINAPFLALGPVSYMFAYLLMSLTRQLCLSGNWAVYLSRAYAFANAIVDAHEFLDNDDLIIANLAKRNLEIEKQNLDRGKR